MTETVILPKAIAQPSIMGAISNKATIIGAGSWGTALAYHLGNKGINVKIWSPFQNEVDMLNEHMEQKDKLPGIILPDCVRATANLEDALNWSDFVVLVVPSQTVRQTAVAMKGKIKDFSCVTICSKGFEESTGKLLSEVVAEELPDVSIAVLSGPSHAEEVSRNIPTTVVCASEDNSISHLVQDVFSSNTFRVYTTADIKGVEIGGALKNIIALCAGISDGLGFGDNTKAALMTRGIVEMTRLGVAMGAQRHTFSGLSGIGDLIVTCTSMHSRNRRAGMLIGSGKTAQEAIEEVKMVVEGITSARAAFELSQKLGIDMPITAEAYNVLFNGKSPLDAVRDLMMREKKVEHEDLEF